MIEEIGTKDNSDIGRLIEERKEKMIMGYTLAEIGSKNIHFRCDTVEEADDLLNKLFELGYKLDAVDCDTEENTCYRAGGYKKGD